MTAEAPKPSTTQPGYSVARPHGRCAVSGREIAPGEKFMAGLRETPEGYERVDVGSECWNAFDKSTIVAFWQATMPQPAAKKKRFVDDTVLCDLFERLAEVEEPAKRNFRFVLGLILMRKRLVIYDSTRRCDDGQEWWIVRLKGREGTLEMFNPHLDESQLAEVSQQLSSVLNEET